MQITLYNGHVDDVNVIFGIDLRYFKVLGEGLYFFWLIVYCLYASDDSDSGGSVGLDGLLGMDWTVYGVVAPVLWV